MVEVDQSVPYLAIADNSTGHKFAYSPPYNKTKFVDDGSRVFTGARSILALLSTAAASLGQILPINAPYNHSSYSIQLDGPIVQCDKANSSVKTLIDSFLQDKMAIPLGTANETVNVYYAFVPAFDDPGRL